MTTDHRKLRQLRHAVEQVLEMTQYDDRRNRKVLAAREQLATVRQTLRLALEATAPEPDPGEALDAAEIHPYAPER